MNQFLLQQSTSRELERFPHMIEFALKRINTLQLDEFYQEAPDLVRVYYIIEGKFEWQVQDQNHTLYPGDVLLVLPKQKLTGQERILNVGTLCWLKIKVSNQANKPTMSPWSGLTHPDIQTIWRILNVKDCRSIIKLKDAGTFFNSMYVELVNREIGHYTRINSMLADLFIQFTRNIINQRTSNRDFPQIFLKLDQTLRQDLAHQWTVEEMATIADMGTTTFTEKVKNYSGFSPLNYLINIRISEAIKQLKKCNANITEIALSTGFYSSQHFATTFKKLTGYTPSQFRKKNLSE
ncbi:AraC-like DNA-binding protein [Pedobacter sp. CAN_A7]|uniref:helix-turn-helix domain-containing protein n=1 Tax=Pedobacter sp. CAN_A7 TaxID=2787722 RepID=UPI0018CA2C67